MQKLPFVLLALVLSACPKLKAVQVDEPTGRCDADLKNSGFFSSVGSGARATLIESTADLVKGANATGVAGDYLLENDRIRVVIQRPKRTIAPAPFGGTIIDADLKRGAESAGSDTFGKIEGFHAFGRSIEVSKVEVLTDGSKGGYAVIAATGTDSVIDYFNVPNVLGAYLGDGLKLVSDPNAPLTLTATTYYVLSPGENRVRMLTAFCNTGKETIVMQTGDLIDTGGESALFNPAGCTNGLGSAGCLVDPSTWVGVQSDGVAYGYRAYQFATPSKPSVNALITIAGITAIAAETQNQSGLLTWLDENAVSRPGAFGIIVGKDRQFLRDFFVAKDLAEISSTLLELDASPKSRLTVTATDADGRPVPFAHVAVQIAETGRQTTLLVTDKNGLAKADVMPGNYRVSTGAPGGALEPPAAIAVPSNGAAAVTVKYGPSRTITVNVKDPFDSALTARVVVVCPSGPCTTPASAYRKLFQVEDLPSNVQAIAFAQATGVATLTVPPGRYEVMVTRGPEYSAYPDTYPVHGQSIDVTSEGATINATLAHVVDTSGWVSADFHVHAINSPDSTVPNVTRVMSFAAEGVDVLVSTDHDFITDYAPIVRDLRMTGVIATMIGCEITPFDFGHQQTYPVAPGEPFDWGNGDGPALRLDQLYAGLRLRDPLAVIQMNHPRGSFGGSLTALKVNTLTSATTALPERFRMAPAPTASATDTKLFSHDFDAIEVETGINVSLAVMNDWFTFMSRGLLKTATSTSDTHNTFQGTGGYGRTWVKVGDDSVAGFSAAALASAVKARHAVGGNGPFVTMTAKRGDTVVSVGDTLSVTSGETIELIVEVQAPEWMQFDSIEIYSHASGRESKDGIENAAWPDDRILQKKTLDPTMLPLEPVPGLNGFNARRVHLVEHFNVTATADTWFVAMVRSSTATRTLFPLAWEWVECKDGTCTPTTSRPVAFTNAILIDADGSGAYDHPPLP